MQTRILAIAPYEGFREIVTKTASEQAQEISVHVYVGDLQQGLAVAESMNLSDYDVIVSRGGTAELLENNLPLPVVSMDPSILDVLRCVRLVRNTMQKYAIVAFPAIADVARKLFSLIEQEEEIRVLRFPEDAYRIIQELKEAGYEAIIGDAIAVSAAETLHLNGFLIASGKESAQAALNEAVRINRLITGVKKSSLALRHVLDYSPLFVVVFGWDRQVFYSNAYGKIVEHGALLKLAKETIPILLEHEQVTRNHRIGSVLWRLEGHRLVSENLYVFYIERKNAFAFDKKGAISFLEPVEEDAHSFTDQIGQMKEIDQKAERMIQSGMPIVISGEAGTPVEEMMHSLCRGGTNRYHSILWVDCEKLEENYLHRLLTSEDSPLLDNDATLCLHHIEAFPQKARREYFDFVSLTRLHSRCRLIYSTEADPGKEWWGFLNRCGCGFLSLPPLRERPEDIPALANLYLSEWNYATGRQILGLEEEACVLLRQYSWPENNDQLRSVIRQALIMADGEMLTCANFATALRGIKSPSLSGNDLSLEGSLDEIMSRVARLVVQEEGGSRQSAADRLGISRTTLWRLTK